MDDLFTKHIDLTHTVLTTDYVAVCWCPVWCDRQYQLTHRRVDYSVGLTVASNIHSNPEENV